MENILDNLTREQLAHLVKVFDIQIAIVLVALAIITQSFFAKLVLNIVNKILKRKSNPVESGMYKPLKFMYVFTAIYLAVIILPLGVRVNIIMKTLLKIAIIIFITNIINTTILIKDSKFFKKIKGKSTNDTVNDFICRILRVVVWLIAAYIIFLVLGVNLSGLVAGLGIGTVIISLAAQDTVKSLLSGFSILSDKPFVIGDWIQVGNYSGTVIDITFRSTRIRSMDNSIITIPNATITSDYIINWNRLKSRRFECILNLEMNVDPEKIKKLIKELKVVFSSKDYVKTDSVYVGFNKIANFSYDIKIFLYVNEIEYIKYLKIEEDLNCEILKILDKEQVSLAYPTETVHIKNQ